MTWTKGSFMEFSRFGQLENMATKHCLTAFANTSLKILTSKLTSKSAKFKNTNRNSKWRKSFKSSRLQCLLQFLLIVAFWLNPLYCITWSQEDCMSCKNRIWRFCKSTNSKKCFIGKSMRKSFRFSLENKAIKGLKRMCFIRNMLSYSVTIWPKSDNWWKIANEGGMKLEDLRQ